jgi:hypothetical protein
MSSRKYWKSRGGGRGSNSKKPTINPEVGSGIGSTTPTPDTSVFNTADSPQLSEGDITHPPITSSLEAIPEQETVQRLVSQLTTPSTVSIKPSVGFAPAIDDEDDAPRLNDDSLVNDSKSDDKGANNAPSIRLANTAPSDTHSDKVPLDTDPRVHPRPKAKPRKRSRRVSEKQSQVDSAELLWYNQIYHATFNTSASGVIFAVVPITLPSGLSLRAGDAIPPDVAELYVQKNLHCVDRKRKKFYSNSFNPEA